jgi:hydroxylamine reductase (hybrid-cluster protein)
MEHIHKKSILAETSKLVLAAHDAGAELLWDRYEQQLPLCAFTSNGLNCRKCFQGPCRINPFGDEPSQGICGADRDQIVMENLFQTTLEGVLESARAAALLGVGDTDQELPDLGSVLSPAARTRLSRAGVLPVRKADLFGVQNGYFSHKGYLSQTLRDLTRLGLIHLGILAQAGAATGGSGTDSAAFDAAGVNLLILGQASRGLLRALEGQAARRSGEKRINLLVQGAAADHGSPELALGMNMNALIVSRNAAWPGAEKLAKRYGIPVLAMEDGKPVDQIAADAIDLACRHAQTAAPGAASRVAPAPGFGRGSILRQGEALRSAFAAGRFTGAVVLFGEANVKQSFFERTLALMEAALGARALVLLGGGLGSEAKVLAAEIEKKKPDALSAFAAELAKEGVQPVASFGSSFEIPGLVSVLNGVAEGDGPALPVAVALPEFYRASTWASAVSFLALGFPVQIGIRLPFWGSPSLVEAITGEWPKITGGRFLAGPALPDPAAQAEELATALKAGRAG